MIDWHTRSSAFDSASLSFLTEAEKGKKKRRRASKYPFLVRVNPRVQIDHELRDRGRSRNRTRENGKMLAQRKRRHTLSWCCVCAKLVSSRSNIAFAFLVVTIILIIHLSTFRSFISKWLCFLVLLVPPWRPSTRLLLSPLLPVPASTLPRLRLLLFVRPNSVSSRSRTLKRSQQ